LSLLQNTQALPWASIRQAAQSGSCSITFHAARSTAT
jgi:hypothetical protein